MLGQMGGHTVQGQGTAAALQTGTETVSAEHTINIDSVCRQRTVLHGTSGTTVVATHMACPPHGQHWAV